jgi:uncharacterized protein YoxC
MAQKDEPIKKIDKVDDKTVKIEEQKTEIRNLNVNKVKKEIEFVEKQKTDLTAWMNKRITDLDAKIAELNQILLDAKGVGVEPDAEAIAINPSPMENV